MRRCQASDRQPGTRSEYHKRMQNCNCGCGSSRAHAPFIDMVGCVSWSASDECTSCESKGEQMPSHLRVPSRPKRHGGGTISHVVLICLRGCVGVDSASQKFPRSRRLRTCSAAPLHRPRLEPFADVGGGRSPSPIEQERVVPTPPQRNKSSIQLC